MKRKVIMGLVVILCIAAMTGCGSQKEEQQGYNPKLPTGVEAADIFVEPIEGISDDFMRGVDISSVLSEEESGVVYKNAAGEEEDIFKILADNGVNYVRVRVWNDPYDAEGNGYGGGNCDAKRAAEIGRRAAEYGMKTYVDFHYSDFWADPSKQMVPKAWKGMTIEEKAAAAYEYTLQAMDTILSAGADVGMVQLGNETNKNMSGESTWTNISQITNNGRKAVLEKAEEYGKDIKIALHFTNIEDYEGMKGLIRKLDSTGAEFDVWALSYYPYWHGSFENFERVMQLLIEKTGKPVLVAETSYMFTVDDGDGNGNSCSEKDIHKNYAATVQSQANEYRDVCASVAKMGEMGLGVFYWEPAWVPVNVYDYTADNAAEVLAQNKELWEKYGSGWASSFASEYDPKDAGVYYGGSSWDNQAMFDFTGKALPSLSVFKYLKYGATCDLKIDFVNNFLKNVNPGSKLELPETVDVIYNDRSKNGPAKVTWNAEELAKVDTNAVGEYPVTGTFEDGTSVTCTVQVAKVNWVKNSSFEDEDRSMWEFIYTGDVPLDFQQKETDAYTGEWAMHYWRNSDVSFKAEQTITDLDDGRYYLSAYIQGGDSGAGASMYLYAVSGENEYRADYSVNGWKEWQHPEIPVIEVTGGTVTIGISFDGGSGAWGTMDDFYLCKLD